MNKPFDNCPHCGEGLWGVFRGRRYRRSIAVEVRGVYDGELFYACPSCWGTWHRFPPDDPLREKAELQCARFTAEMRKNRSRRCSE